MQRPDQPPIATVLAHEHNVKGIGGNSPPIPGPLLASRPLRSAYTTTFWQTPGPPAASSSMLVLQLKPAQQKGATSSLRSLSPPHTAPSPPQQARSLLPAFDATAQIRFVFFVQQSLLVSHADPAGFGLHRRRRRLRPPFLASASSSSSRETAPSPAMAAAKAVLSRP